MRTNGTLSYLPGDHLGSTSLTTDASGQVISELRYMAWGEVRFVSGQTPTQYQYTGQYSHASDFGLLFYNARWYGRYLNHFTQPDTIVPDPYNSLHWNRYSYARYNPLKYTDPSGHVPCTDDGYCGLMSDTAYQKRIYSNAIKDVYKVEGIINHHLLGIHHVNETVPPEQWIYWDVGFLVWGALMLVGGWFLWRAGKRETVMVE